MGAIGLGSRGSGNLCAFLGRGHVHMVAVCDVRQNVCDTRKSQVDAHYKNKDCAVYNDFREMLARTDIDAVLVATPDHCQAIIVVEACRKGEDVYCEKPESLTLPEGPKMVAAARRYGRVVSGGSQRVLEDYRGVVDTCWSGAPSKKDKPISDCRETLDLVAAIGAPYPGEAPVGVAACEVVYDVVPVPLPGAVRPGLAAHEGCAALHQVALGRSPSHARSRVASKGRARAKRERSGQIRQISSSS